MLHRPRDRYTHGRIQKIYTYEHTQIHCAGVRVGLFLYACKRDRQAQDATRDIDSPTQISDEKQHILRDMIKREMPGNKTIIANRETNIETYRNTFR